MNMPNGRAKDVLFEKKKHRLKKENQHAHLVTDDSIQKLVEL